MLAQKFDNVALVKDLYRTLQKFGIFLEAVDSAGQSEWFKNI